MKLIILDQPHFKELYEIVSEPSVMLWVGIGKPWSKEKVQDLINFSVKDRKTPKKNRDYFYWVMIEKKKIIGLIGIHKISYEKKNPNFFVTRILHHDYLGKGYGTIALNKVISKFKKMRPDVKTIFSDTLMDNIRAQKSLAKTNFHFVGNIKIGNKNYSRHFYNL